ncbi:unnamed protein product, partial [marine sediment metagenome]
NSYKWGQTLTVDKSLPYGFLLLSPQDAPGEISLAPVSTQEYRVILYIEKITKNQPQIVTWKIPQKPSISDMGYGMGDVGFALWNPLQGVR